MNNQYQHPNLVEQRKEDGRTVRHYSFDNGYGAIVVSKNKGYWDLCVLKGDIFDFSTPVTDSVLHDLNDPQIENQLGIISRLGEQND